MNTPAPIAESGVVDSLQIRDESSNPLRERMYEVRSMPQSTPEEVEEKRFEAMKLRMDNLLTNASIWSEIMDVVSQNPSIKPDEVFERLTHSSSINVSTAELRGVLNSIAHQTSVVVDAYSRVEDYTIENHNLTDGVSFLELYLGYFYPFADVTLLKSPFAITLVVDPETFALVDNRTNVGGFYLSQRTLNVEGEYHTVPFIFIKDTGPSHFRIGNHEDLHAKNMAFVRATTVLPIDEFLPTKGDGFLASKGSGFAYYRNSKSKKYWGSHSDFIRLDRAFIKSHGDSPDEGNYSDEDLAKLEEQKNKLLEYALSRAKDEVIAAMAEGTAFSARFHLLNLKDPDGLYNYFAKLGLDPESHLYAELSKEYYSRLDRQVVQAIKLYEFYSGVSLEGFRDVTNPDLKDRRKLLTSLLIQHPMSLWNQRLESAGFTREAEEISELLTELLFLEHNLVETDYLSSKKDVHRMHEMRYRALALYDQFTNKLKISSDHNYFNILQEYRSKASQLKSDAEDIEMYRANYLVANFRQWYMGFKKPLVAVEKSSPENSELVRAHFQNYPVFESLGSFEELKAAIESAREVWIPMLNQLGIETPEWSD